VNVSVCFLSLICLLQCDSHNFNTRPIEVVFVLSRCGYESLTSMDFLLYSSPRDGVLGFSTSNKWQLNFIV